MWWFKAFIVAHEPKKLHLSYQSLDFLPHPLSRPWDPFLVHKSLLYDGFAFWEWLGESTTVWKLSQSYQSFTRVWSFSFCGLHVLFVHGWALFSKYLCLASGYARWKTIAMIIIIWYIRFIPTLFISVVWHSVFHDSIPWICLKVEILLAYLHEMKQTMASLFHTV